MKKTIIESTSLDNILGLFWAMFIVMGSVYLVFWKGISAWWLLVDLLLLNVSVYHRKEVIEED